MNAPYGYQVDHKEHDTLDNRKSELRTCTPSQNNCNRRTRSDNNSGMKGVSWAPKNKKWRVRVWLRGKVTNLGLYRELPDAIQAYREGALAAHGPFAYVRIPNAGGVESPSPWR